MELLSMIRRLEYDSNFNFFGMEIGIWGGNAVIRAFRENDLISVMQIWFDTNINAHSFIPKEYWTDNYAVVKEILPQTEVYVYE